MITATVLDADGSEHETQVSIDEDESQIVGSLCSCSDFYQAEGLCCHCVAILLKYISRRHIQTSFPSKKQNRIGQTLIESYIHQSSGSHYPAEASETKVLIELEPILHKQYHKLSVDFKIGTGKKYVIKDLLEFARLIHQGELFQYGKNLKRSCVYNIINTYLYIIFLICTYIIFILFVDSCQISIVICNNRNFCLNTICNLKET